MVVSRRQAALAQKDGLIAVARITSKGQITLPKKLRDQMGLHTGDEVAFVRGERGIRIIRHFRENPFEKWRGYLKHLKGRDPDELVRDWRGR